MIEDTTGKPKLAVATEMDYGVKLHDIKLLMIFPHNFSTMNGRVMTYEVLEAHMQYDTTRSSQRIRLLKNEYLLVD